MSDARSSSFLKNVRASGLIGEARLQEVESWPSAATGNDRALAQELVNKGVLTRFQAEQILAGRTEGFLIGPYVVTDRIGAGGMGQVYKAVHRQMERTVALKVLPKARRADPQAQARFMREVRASAKLIHPNIVTAFDVGEERHITYLAMEYVRGQDLHHLINARGRLEPGQAAGIIFQVAWGLEHARKRGIVHRDIKPANILVDEEGVAKILDMGLARIHHEGDEKSGTLTTEGTVVGTMDYVAPEQTQYSHEVDTRADIYSLGCTLYHALTGRLPFPGGTIVQKMYRHVHEPHTPVPELVPDVPPELTAVVDTMMAKSPDDRYQTPAEVAEALRPWVSGSIADMGSGAAVTPTAAQPTPPGVRPSVAAGLANVTAEPPRRTDPAKPRGPAAWRRVPIWAWGAAGGGAVVLIAAILFWPSGGPESVRPPEHPERTAAQAPESAAATKTGTASEPVQPPAAAVQPIVRADGSGKGPYRTLKDAFADCKPDEDVVIELRANGVLHAGGLSVTCRDLVLRAGKGFRPLVMPPPTLKRARMLTLDAERSVVVQGLHFVSSPHATTYCLYTNAPVVRVLDCTQQMSGFGIYLLCPAPGRTREVHVHNCFFAGGTLLLTGATPLTATVRQIEMSNCAGLFSAPLMTLDAVGANESPRLLEVRLTRNTLVFRLPLMVLRQSDNTPIAPKGLTMHLERNVLCGRLLARIHIYGPLGQRDRQARQWKDALRWQGRDNVLWGFSPAVATREYYKDGSSRNATVVGDLREFLKTWAPRMRATHTELPSGVSKYRQIPGHQWRLKHVRDLQRSLPPSVPGAGADLSRLPDPPEVDASGNLVRPARPPEKPRSAEASAAPVEPPSPVVRADGSGKGPYQTLKEAFADCKPDEDVVIELRTNRALEASGLQVSAGNLTIRAGEGYRPTVLKSGPASKDGPRHMIEVQASGTLVVHGLHFVLRGTRLQDACLLVDAPVVRVRACSFRSVGTGVRMQTAIRPWRRARQVTVQDSLCTGVGDFVLSWMSSGRLELTNCAVAGGHSLLAIASAKTTVKPTDALQVRLHRNTAVGLREPLLLVRSSADRVVPASVTLYLVDNVLLPWADQPMPCAVLVGGPQGDVKLSEWQRSLAWQGRGNVFGRCLAGLRTREVRADGKLVQAISVPDLASFLRTWAPGLTDTRVGTMVAPFRHDEVSGDAWRVSHFQRVREVLPADVRHAGADLTTVPDPPNIPAVSPSADAGVPTPTVPPQPALPVVRADGSGEGPYQTLKDAFAACKPDQDVVIELRTNRVLSVREQITATCKTLTVRAGKGFRPVLWRESTTAGLVLAGTGSVLVEGLHFAMDPRRSGGTDIRVLAPKAEVRRCTFRQKGRGTALSMSDPTRDLIVRNCFFAGYGRHVCLRAVTGRVHLSNCVSYSGSNLLTLEPAAGQGSSAGQLHATLHGNTIVACYYPFQVVLPFRKGRRSPMLTIELERNVVLPGEGSTLNALLRLWAEGRTPDAQEARRAVDWQGHSNLIGRCRSAVEAPDSRKGVQQRVKPLISDAARFLRSFAPKLSRTRYQAMTAPFAVGTVPWDGWRLKHFQRIHKVLPSDLRDVGADLSRIPDPPDLQP